MVNLASNQRNGKIALILSLIVFVFFLAANVIFTDVYKYAAMGVFFEFLSLPMLLFVIAIPIYCIVQVVKTKSLSDWYVVGSFVIITITVLMLVYFA